LQRLDGEAHLIRKIGGPLAAVLSVAGLQLRVGRPKREPGLQTPCDIEEVAVLAIGIDLKRDIDIRSLMYFNVTEQGGTLGDLPLFQPWPHHADDFMAFPVQRYAPANDVRIDAERSCRQVRPFWGRGVNRRRR